MIDVKILNSLIPIFPDKEPQGKELSALTMCQNQAVQFQMAFKTADRSTAYSNFFIRIESDIPVSVYYINNVPVIHTSSVDGAPPIGLYPDILLPKKTNPKLSNYAYPWGDFIAEEDEDTSVDTSTEKKPNPVVLWVSIAVAVLVLAAGGVTAFLLLKKKNRK